MLKFVVKRLLVAIPSFLGICVATFALIHLIPGDPIESRGIASNMPLTPETIQQTREYFGLDLPLFFNSQPMDRSRLLCQALVQQDPESIKEVIELGTAILPALLMVLELDLSFPAAQPIIVKILEHNPGLYNRDTGQAVLSPETRKQLRLTLQRARVTELIKNIDSIAAVRRLEVIGTFANPHLIEALKTADGAQAEGLTKALSRINRRSAIITPGDNASIRSGIKQQWYQYFAYQERYYRVLTFPTTLTATVTDTQFYQWFTRIIKFDFGVSFVDGRHISEKLIEALPVTVGFSLCALFLAYLCAIPLGLSSAVHHDQRWERVSTGVLFMAWAIPSYWLATILLKVFAGQLQWFPADGLHSVDSDSMSSWHYLLDTLWHSILPLICLTYLSFIVLSRYMKRSMLEILQQDYLRTAHAMGVPFSRVIWRHGLRNALTPLISIFGMMIPTLIGGSIVVEKVFGIPGMGLLAFESILYRDYPLLMAITTLTALLTLMGLLLSDLLSALADPRIRLYGGEE